MVSSSCCGLSALPPVTVPVTATVLSSVSSTLSSAVTVTVPVLAVVPAAMSSVVPLCVKSPADARVPGSALTSTLTAALDRPLNVAVTVLLPPSSPIVEGVSVSDTAGVASSSVIVSVCGAGAATPRPPDTVADTVTDLSGASTWLFTAVMVTVPVLPVEPAEIVSVAPLCARSPATAGDTAEADTDTVTASLDVPLSAAVTVDAPPFSSIDEGSSPSDTTGSASSFVIVIVPVAGVAASVTNIKTPNVITKLLRIPSFILSSIASTKAKGSHRSEVAQHAPIPEYFKHAAGIQICCWHLIPN